MDRQTDGQKDNLARQYSALLEMNCLITTLLVHILLSLQDIEQWLHFVHITYSMQLSYRENY